MTALPALTIHQPWATLCVTRQPCDNCINGGPPVAQPYCDGCQMVKRYETRTRKPPSTIVGKRVILHAAKRQPDEDVLRALRFGMRCLIEYQEPAAQGWVTTFNGQDCHLPLGAIVGSAIIGEGTPIVDKVSISDRTQAICQHGDGELRLWHPRGDPGHWWHDISDQLPYGDWTPGRWAWPLTDARPITEWCPWCEGTGCEGRDVSAGSSARGDDGAIPCEACDGRGRFESPPAYSGRQGVFYIDARR